MFSYNYPHYVQNFRVQSFTYTANAALRFLVCLEKSETMPWFAWIKTNIAVLGGAAPWHYTVVHAEVKVE